MNAWTIAGTAATLLKLWHGSPQNELTMARSDSFRQIILRMQAGTRRINATVKPGVTCSELSGHEKLSGIELVPEGAPSDRVVLYFHGGAHCLFSPNSHKSLMSSLALASKARYVAIDYRKAPEHPFPAALDDAVMAWQWVRRSYPQAKIAIAGDSAGGNLAFALLVKLAQIREAMPIACVGLSPWLMLDVTKVADFRQRECFDNQWTASFVSSLVATRGGTGEFIDKLLVGKVHDVIAAQYFQDHPCTDPLVTPLYAEEEIVKRFPPVLIHAAEKESLVHDARAMVELCSNAGVPAQLKIYENAGHAFQYSARKYPEQAEDSIALIGQFLDGIWAGRVRCSL